MGYREMVMDAGYDPDSDEGQMMAAGLEADEQKAYEESQEPDIVPCPKCGSQMWETEETCDQCKKIGKCLACGRPVHPKGDFCATCNPRRW